MASSMEMTQPVEEFTPVISLPQIKVLSRVVFRLGSFLFSWGIWVPSLATNGKFVTVVTLFWALCKRMKTKARSRDARPAKDNMDFGAMCLVLILFCLIGLFDFVWKTVKDSWAAGEEETDGEGEEN
ncbi:hypothetical protein B0T19DRAFT_425307 [Cercophora scortea]|uniref:Uncharacterized protein n=1 Tax=Cercophora scortea TaxID=314031 RepID=A0AAE0M9S3_9PEZI|nr:hypothetical protein B0T19DRAFT_425307 [Cercophora scortea]